MTPQNRPDPDDQDDTATAATLPAPPSPERSPGGGPFKVYKPSQGTNVRWASAGGAALLSLAGAQFVYEQLLPAMMASSNSSAALTTRYLVPVIFFVAMLYLIFRFVGQSPKIVDFLIATEGEMKKVNWSTRKEIGGATRVVIFTLLALGTILFLVDVFFMVFFEQVGVLKINLLKSLFSGGKP
ncbi:preprotein translocase subunit SecE [Phycisphaerae bacterium RAS1]|nr:preprotein translocase subunit SecE [Phycisphaerae bacterium RAS1]